ncbi:MAG: OadG family protein [Candidatus Peribacteraceae bacterium]|nr:OadG family protein [Candidatus Peribacteraceae bacterium]
MIDDGYLTMSGMVLVFFLLFLPAMSIIVHVFKHYVNGEFKKWCVWCWLGRLVDGRGN